jgi:hypothetical protein
VERAEVLGPELEDVIKKFQDQIASQVAHHKQRAGAEEA